MDYNNNNDKHSQNPEHQNSNHYYETPNQNQRPYERYQSQTNDNSTSSQNQIPYIQPPNYSNQPDTFPAVSILDWVLSYLALTIPCVNIVMLCIWAFSSNTNPSKQNWARAMFIMIVIGIVLGIAFSSLIASLLTNAMYY